MKSLNLIPLLVLFVLMQSCKTSNTKIVWVGGFKTICSLGAGKGSCFAVSENPSLDEANWVQWSQNIEGFSFEEGILKQIEIREETIQNPPADGSSIKYTLIREIKKQEDMRTRINGQWILVKLNNKPINKMVKTPTISIDLSESRVSGSTGCNNYKTKILSLGTKDIKLSAAMSTKMACMGKNIEPEFLNALSAVTSYGFENDVLNFYDEKGSSVLSFLQRSTEALKKFSQNVTGGWSEAEIDSSVKEAVSYILSEIKSKSALKEILSAKKQVVKGMNYNLTIALEDGAIWSAIVYKDLTGELSFLKLPVLKKK